jgi:hypothetical protein
MVDILAVVKDWFFFTMLCAHKTASPLNHVAGALCLFKWEANNNAIPASSPKYRSFCLAYYWPQHVPEFPQFPAKLVRGGVFSF